MAASGPSDSACLTALTAAGTIRHQRAHFRGEFPEHVPHHMAAVIAVSPHANPYPDEIRRAEPFHHRLQSVVSAGAAAPAYADPPDGQVDVIRHHHKVRRRRVVVLHDRRNAIARQVHECHRLDDDHLAVCEASVGNLPPERSHRPECGAHVPRHGIRHLKPYGMGRRFVFPAGISKSSDDLHFIATAREALAHPPDQRPSTSRML